MIHPGNRFVGLKRSVESSITAQIAIRFIIVLTPVVLAVAFAASIMDATIGHIRAVTEEAETEVVPLAQLEVRMRQAEATAYSTLFRSIRADAPAESTIDQLVDEMARAFDDVLTDAALVEERGDLEAARYSWGQAVAVLHAMSAPMDDPALDRHVNLFRLRMEAGADLVGQARQQAELNLNAELTDAEEIQSDALPGLIAMCGAALLLGLVMAWRLARHLIRPLKQLRDASTRFADGDLDHRVATDRPDELGELARAFDSMAEQIETTHRELARRALHDSLTGLPNRVLLADRVGHALESDRRRGGRSALLVVDIDDFKRVNDGFGHAAGDEAIQVVGSRIAGLSRRSDTVARLGGDEFSILLEDVDGEEAATAFAVRCLEEIRKPALIGDRRAMLEASVGLVVTEDGHVDEQTMMRRADMAMYAAKASGKDRVVCFSIEMEQALEDRLLMENDLRSVIEHGSGLFLDYQPIIEMDSGRIVGAEALMRMRHPHHGVLPPSSFIMLAEESGLITSLTRWALIDACSHAGTWTRTASDLASAPFVSVNLSARQLDDPALLSDVRAAIEEGDIAPAQLLLEITETAMMVNQEAALEVLGELRNLGVRIAIDDFGTGYSSLSYLKDLPVDVLKIDKSFVDELDSEGGRALIETINSMARSLSLETVAEGVEHLRQVQGLVDSGCRLAQGFLYSRPIPPDQVTALIERGSVPVARHDPATPQDRTDEIVG